MMRREAIIVLILYISSNTGFQKQKHINNVMYCISILYS
jgi:hypothetical protein